ASLRGGLYPSISGDFLFSHHSQLGIQGEVAWRASQENFGGGEPYRPIFWDFNGIWAPRFGKAATGELMAGIGAESSRFYQNGYVCGFTGCTNYVSYTHFMGHVGGGVRFYLHGGLFVRPEAHLYLVNNNQYFSSSRVGRVGVSLGYSFGR
ncbi:MAG: hypothetical protein JOY93_10860, partial [Acidobacteriales bacterium]|nr:hypothetical protein [Terriglobales bacterium]